MRLPANKQDKWLNMLGESIRSRRMRLGMSQIDLATTAGVHRTYISDIERGARNVTVLTIHRIAIALRVCTAELFAYADQMAKDDLPKGEDGRHEAPSCL